MRASEDQLKAWMVGGLDGDADAHATLLGTLVPILRAFYGRRMGDGSDIEDLVQETLIAVHTRRATYDRDRHFTAWLFAIARHKMIDHFRKGRQFVTMEGLDHILAVEGFEDSSNARMDVGHLLDTLPPLQARAIRRTKIDGLSTSEAARDVGVGESNLKVSVHRGLKALAARVRGERR